MGSSESDRIPTDEELRRVRAYECAQQYGHSYDVVLAEGRDKPVAIVCLHCGQRWPVFTPRSQKPFSRR